MDVCLLKEELATNHINLEHVKKHNFENLLVFFFPDSILHLLKNLRPLLRVDTSGIERKKCPDRYGMSVT